MSDLELRAIDADLEYREDAETGYLEGTGVPWDQTVTIHNADGTSFRERFERGSVDLDGTVWLYDSHKTPIGVVEVAETRDDGLWIRAKLALSDLAKSVHERLLNGSLNKLSVGFTPQEHREEDGVIVRTRTRLREVSVVARPAYSLASVLAVREESTDRPSVTTHKEESAMTDSQTVDLTEVRADIEEIRQSLAMLPEQLASTATPEVDTRSAAEVLQAIAKGDRETIDAYEREMEARAYTGGTTADAPMKASWVDDLTRIFDASSGVLSEVFAKGTLPEKGNTIEFAELASNTVQFAKQANEGDDLAYGKVTLTTRTAPVETFGGYVQLTRQAIQRSNLPVLDRSLEALAVAAGARKKAVLRSAFGTVVAAREAIASNGGVVVLGATLAASAAGNWEDALIDAALKYDLEDSRPEALIVSVSVFKKLRSLTVSGERVFQVWDKNASGTLDLPGLTGNLAGLPVYLDAGQTGDKAVFVNGRAIRQYDSGLVSLQDENIINLSKDFSAYRYGAIAAEIPQLVVPVKLAAS
ncbi:HK97 family phage prohead protease [Microbacterium hominis]|uniref:HK97 family phage prohead protease n=1 Tax=Microbacterium hominis TaxID=162426 RepID=UPI0019646FC8|nr:HK97 family phage prohead protease [Microbacterium hominis]QRY40852.1 HK97 family phage prohead protease [Microbacterium hominis]